MIPDITPSLFANATEGVVQAGENIFFRCLVRNRVFPVQNESGNISQEREIYLKMVDDYFPKNNDVVMIGDEKFMLSGVAQFRNESQGAYFVGVLKCE